MQERQLWLQRIDPSSIRTFPSETVRKLQEQKVIYGVGISINSNRTDQRSYVIEVQPHIKELSNTVWHVIIGVTDPKVFLKASRKLNRVLILGYKQFGFGSKYFSQEVQQNINQ